MANKNYFIERDQKNIAKVRNICSQLPTFVGEFFLGIQHTTTPLTRLNYAHDLRIFFDFLASTIYKKTVISITINDLSILTAHHIELFLDHLTFYVFNDKKYSCSNVGKERKLSTIRSFFNYFYKRDRLEKNVAVKVDMPKVSEKPIVRLELHEISRLMDQLDAESPSGLTPRQKSYHKQTKIRDCAILTLFLGTGIRISELVGLDRTDVDFSNESFKVTRKGGEQSILYFPYEVRSALRNYDRQIIEEVVNKTPLGRKIVASGSAALFYSLQGTRMTVRAVENMVKKYTALIAPLKNITPHKLRSTYGTELYRKTKDIYIVAEVLGHKDINTTKKHYAAISENMRKFAADQVRLREGYIPPPENMDELEDIGEIKTIQDLLDLMD